MNHEERIKELAEEWRGAPEAVADRLRVTYYRLEQDYLSWLLALRVVSQAIPVQTFKGLHKGQRAFIVCNGPSLNMTDLTLLRDEITFGCNRIYIGLDRWNLTLRYWAVQDETQIMQQHTEYTEALPSETVKFIPLQFAPWFSEKSMENVSFPYMEFFYESYPLFSFRDPWFYSGMTVSYWMMQLAFYMGCSEIYIVGMDHSYRITERELKGRNRWSDEQSQSHFHPDYMNAKNGQLWNLPDVEKMELAYRKARAEIEAGGGRILNATPNSKCDVFDRVKYEDLF